MAERPLLTLLTGDPHPQRWLRLVWAGDIDAFSVRPLAIGLREAWALDPLVLEVDLSGVTFMDSSGLRPLVDAHARLRHRMRLFDPAPPVTRLLHILGLQDMFLVVGPVPARSPAEKQTLPVRLVAEDADAADARHAGPPLATGDLVMIEQAKGLLMAVHGCDASAAYEILRSHAMVHDVQVHTMAGLLVAQAPGAAPPTSETVLDDVMAERARARPSAE